MAGKEKEAVTLDPDQRRIMEAFAADADPEGMYGGIAGLWRLPADHPFQDIWKEHDQMYVLARLGFIKDPSSKKTDRRSLVKMIRRARERKSLGLERMARTFYYPAMRVWGFFRWPGRQ